MRSILLLVMILVLSQGESQTPWKFRSSNYAGLLNGESGNYGLVQTINGFYRGSWFIGAGAGLDYYRFRSIPLFLSVNRDLVHLSQATRIFAGLDGGINLPWYYRPDNYWGQGFHSTFRAGGCWSGTLGLRVAIPSQPRQAFLFAAGYGFKELKENQPPAENPIRYDYRNRYWVFKMGWQF